MICLKKINYSNFLKKKFDIIFNFAAQAGVRYSYENPESYCNSNIVGFNNLLNLIKKFKVKKILLCFIIISVWRYWSVSKKEISKPNTLNIYSLSKLANEITAKTWSIKSKTQIIGLRFFQFTVNGVDQIC